MIYGYLVTYTDGTNSKTYKDYGFVTAETRADAIREIENWYDNTYATIDEISIHTVTDEENSCLLDKYQIEFFVDAAKQNGYDEEGN